MTSRHYRSLGYMRPLSIWSIQWALEKFHPQYCNEKTESLPEQATAEVNREESFDSAVRSLDNIEESKEKIQVELVKAAAESQASVTTDVITEKKNDSQASVSDETESSGYQSSEVMIPNLDS